MAKKDDKKTKDKKDKKGKKTEVPSAGTPSTGAKTGTPSTGAPTTTGTPSTPAMTADQMTMAQIEQSLKDANSPENQLKRLRNPINVRSCLLNILILLCMTFGIFVIWCAIQVDTFDFGTVMSDMFSSFGITQGFQWLGAQIASWFS